MKYAIVETGGKQYKTVEGSIIDVDLLPVEPGVSITLGSVLLMVNDEKIVVGTPVIEGARVDTTVIDHVKGPKIDVFRYRPKKRVRVKTGHRQQYTRLKIEKIEME